MSRKNELDVPEECREREYIEIIASLRHYSSLRFSALSVFYAVTAALVIGAYGLNAMEGVQIDATLSPIFKAMGLLATLIFYTYDVMIDGYQVGFRRHLKNIWPYSHWFKRPSYGLFFQVPIWLLYWSLLAFWGIGLAMDNPINLVKGFF